MADEHEGDILELDEPLEVDELEGEEPDQPDTGGDDDDLPSFSDDTEEQVAPAETELVRKLRKEIRERDKRLAQTVKSPAEQPIEVGDRPKIEAFDYDQDRFDAAVDEWDARREAKRQQDQRYEAQQRQQNESWQQVQNNYATKKAALRYPDKDQREAAAFEALSAVQQAVIAKVAPDPALLIYAVGGNQAKLDQLASIDDPLVLAATIGRMGATLTTKKRNTAPEPERIVRGGTVRSQDKVMAKLEADAERTGDRSKLIAYRTQQKK